VTRGTWLISKPGLRSAGRHWPSARWRRDGTMLCRNPEQQSRRRGSSRVRAIWCLRGMIWAAMVKTWAPIHGSAHPSVPEMRSTRTGRRLKPCWRTGRVRNAKRLFRAFRGNGLVQWLPAGALETQSANEGFGGSLCREAGVRNQGSEVRGQSVRTEAAGIEVRMSHGSAIRRNRRLSAKKT
jgi:hypothetical protein